MTELVGCSGEACTVRAVFTFEASSGKRLSPWLARRCRLSVTHQGVARDAASVHFRPSIMLVFAKSYKVNM